MNYCRKCQSDYEKPGTCNCFAPDPPRESAPVYVPYPYVPYVPYSPWWTTPLWYGGSGTSVTITPAASTATIAWNGPIASNTVSIEQAVKSSAGVSFTAGGSC